MLRKAEALWEPWQVQGWKRKRSGLWEVTSSSRVGWEPVGNQPCSLGRIFGNTESVYAAKTSEHVEKEERSM